MTAELRLHLHLMLRYRRWGEKLIFLALLLVVIFVVLSMLGKSLLSVMDSYWGMMVIKGTMLLLWPVLLLGLLAAWQIYRTASIAFSPPRAIGYLVLTSVFALVPGFLLFRYMPVIYGSLLAFPLWFGIFIVPSLMKEEIRRRFELRDYDNKVADEPNT